MQSLAKCVLRDIRPTSSDTNQVVENQTRVFYKFGYSQFNKIINMEYMRLTGIQTLSMILGQIQMKN